MSRDELNPHPSSLFTCIFSQVKLLTHSINGLSFKIDLGATKYVKWDRGGFTDYCWISSDTQNLFIENNIREDVILAGSHELMLSSRIYFDPSWCVHAWHNFLSVVALLRLDFTFSCSNSKLNIYLDSYSLYMVLYFMWFY